jgi:hypothetical protein
MSYPEFSGILLVSTALMFSTPATASVPIGWTLAGSRPQDYDVGTIAVTATSGKGGAYLKCVAEQANGFGTLMQEVSADAYHGKRVRLSANAKASDVQGWAGLWMRVDGDGSRPLAFDNMGNRPIKGTTDWKRYEVVLDVADQATAVAFGILLTGKGSVEVDTFRIEVVDASVPTTTPPKSMLPVSPRNLGFDD